MKIHCRYDRLVSVKELKPHPKNRNKHPKDQVDRLAKIIAYQGVRAPIVVSKLSGYIVKGHGTLLAIKKNKMDSVPVVDQEFNDLDQEYAFLQSDNAIASWAELDVEGIKGDLSDLVPGFDTELLGLRYLDIAVTDMEKEAIEDDVPDVTESISKLGDLYELGEHRLLCGDSTDKATVERLMNGEKADMVLSDPPYGMKLDTDWSDLKGSMSAIAHTKGGNYKKVIGDNEDFKPSLIKTFFDNFGYCKEIFLFGSDYFAELLKNKNDGSWLVWDKRKETQAEAIGSEFELIWSKNKHKRRMLRHDWFGFLSSQNTKEARNRVHPTQKPTSLLVDILNQWGKEKEIVIDLYGGSGSTLIACEKTKRKCFMMELDPHYIDVIVSRWCKYTGTYKVKRNGEEIQWPQNT